MKPVRTLVVDDNRAFQDVMSRYLSLARIVEVVGYASTADEAYRKISDNSPDLVVMDVVMPKTTGLEAVRRIKRMPSPPAVILYTFCDEPEYRAAAAAAGADAFITKTELWTSLLWQVQQLFQPGRRAALEPAVAAAGHEHN